MLEAADLQDRYYLGIKTYPDEELLRIADTAADLTGTPSEEILYAYGESLVGDLLGTYDAFLRDEWDALDVLANTETAMHKAVRMKEADASPPELNCRRAGDDEVVIEYGSDLELCKFGEGLIAGIGDAFDTSLAVSQDRCMLENDPNCEIHVSRNGHSQRR